VSVAREIAQPVGNGYAPYVWAPAVDEVAERHGVPREAVLKFDQNTPALPGVPQVPLAQSMARLNEYPDGTYRELLHAAASYVGLSSEHVVVGAGADDLILLLAQVFLGPGRSAAVAAPTYALYRIATTLRGADVVAAGDGADLHWVCNPNNPTGAWVEPEEIAGLAERAPRSIVVVDEAYVEYGARSCAPWVDELPNLVVLRTL
jgi:histidinol-phosphate aminotransferase